MEIKEAKKCKECNGIGTLSTDYIDADHNVQRGAGDDVTCENCEGTGQEPDEEIVVERIIENLTAEQENVLQQAHTEQDMGTLDDDLTDAYEKWLCDLSLSDLETILK